MRRILKVYAISAIAFTLAWGIGWGINEATASPDVSSEILAAVPFPNTTGEILEVLSSCSPGRVCSSARFTATAPSGATAYTLREGASICLNPDGRVIADGGTSFQCDNIMSYAINSANLINSQSLVITTDGGVSIISTTANAGLRVAGSTTMTGTLGVGSALSLTGTTATISASSVTRIPLTVVDTEGLRLQGVTTANLTPPDGGFAGTIQYDTTTNKLKVVESNTWQTILTGGAGGTFSGTWVGVAPESDGTYSNLFPGGYVPKTYGGTFERVTCSATATGTGGTNGITAAIIDYGVGTVCSCILSGSNTCAAASPQVPQYCDCAGTMTPGHTYGVSFLGATDCTANPTNVTCTVQFTTP